MLGAALLLGILHSDKLCFPCSACSLERRTVLTTFVKFPGCVSKTSPVRGAKYPNSFTILFKCGGAKWHNLIALLFHPLASTEDAKNHGDAAW